MVAEWCDGLGHLLPTRNLKRSFEYWLGDAIKLKNFHCRCDPFFTPTPAGSRAGRVDTMQEGEGLPVEGGGAGGQIMTVCPDLTASCGVGECRGKAGVEAPDKYAHGIEAPI